MKVLAGIILFFFVSLGIFQLQEESFITDDHATKDMSCCHPHDEAGSDKDEASDHHGDCEDHPGHDCLPGCSCDCHFHVSVYVSPASFTTGQSISRHIQYRPYKNIYSFEYLEGLFQPPRFS